MKRPLDQWEPTSVGIGQRSRSRRPLPTVRWLGPEPDVGLESFKDHFPSRMALISSHFWIPPRPPPPQLPLAGASRPRRGLDQMRPLVFSELFSIQAAFNTAAPRAFRRAALNYPSWKQLHSKAETQVSSASIFALFSPHCPLGWTQHSPFV